MKFLTQDIAHAAFVGSEFGLCLSLCSAPYLYLQQKKSFLRFFPRHLCSVTLSTGAAFFALTAYLTKIIEIRTFVSRKIQAATKLQDPILPYAVSASMAFTTGLGFRLIFRSTKLIQNFLLFLVILEYQRMYSSVQKK